MFASVVKQGPVVRGRSPVVAEAHWPYVPADWNGVLVLGEAQNLAVGPRTPGQVRNYSEAVRASTSAEERAGRLTGRPGCMPVGWVGPAVHVRPWHSGPLRVAVACHGHEPARCAVTNAVPWAWVRDGRDDNQALADPVVVDAAARFLVEAFAERPPQVIYACGGRAHAVMRAVGAAGGWPAWSMWRQGSYRSLGADRRAWTGAFTAEAVREVLPAKARAVLRDRSDLYEPMKPRWAALFVAHTLGLVPPRRAQG